MVDQSIKHINVVREARRECFNVVVTRITVTVLSHLSRKEGFALGWSIRLSLLLLTKEMHDILQQTTSQGWLNVQDPGQQQADMSMSTKPNQRS